MVMGAGFIPKPDDSWPMWLVVVYYIIMAIIGLGVVAVMVIKTFKFLKKGQAGVRVRRGQPVMRDGEFAYVGPGIHPMIPFVDSIEDVSVQTGPTDLPLILAERCNVQYVIDAKPIWSVINTPQGVHDAIFVTKNLEESVTSHLCKALNRAVESVTSITDKTMVEAATVDSCKEALEQIGVQINNVGLISVTRVPVQVLGELLNPGAGNKITDVGQMGGAAALGLGLVQGGQAG